MLSLKQFSMHAKYIRNTCFPKSFLSFLKTWKDFGKRSIDVCFNAVMRISYTNYFRYNIKIKNDQLLSPYTYFK